MDRKSGYETHFNRKRQLKTENAAQEIYISENGPLLVRNFFSYFDLQLMNLYCQVHADKLLKRALDKFFIAESNSANWHFYHSDLTRFYESDHSKTVKRLQAQRSRLSFVEKWLLKYDELYWPLIVIAKWSWQTLTKSKEIFCWRNKCILLNRWLLADTKSF